MKNEQERESQVEIRTLGVCGVASDKPIVGRTIIGNCDEIGNHIGINEFNPIRVLNTHGMPYSTLAGHLRDYAEYLEDTEVRTKMNRITTELERLRNMLDEKVETK